jgi:hypothetical protein
MGGAQKRDRAENFSLVDVTQPARTVEILPLHFFAQPIGA